MYRLYQTLDVEDNIVSLMLEKTKNISPIEFGRGSEYTNFVKTNAFECIRFPKCCYSFDTNITTWKELRSICKDKIVAGLYKRKV